MTTRNATAHWNGKHSNGTGTLSAPSNVLSDTPYSFHTRFQDAAGAPQTTPEELLAAAHAGCYAMSLGFALEQAGLTAERIDVDATVTLSEMDGGFEISQIHLNVDATVPGLSASDFEETAEAAKVLCPLSLALHCVPISLQAKLSD